jgi:peptidoglycan/LPS O-acetylase OafA/YrhL
MQYRREIDGLRAIAVMPVILFHAGFSVFSGGYVGVDVFFVISGYLITSLILADIETGTFSIARFYERRARRILPALTVVMLACIPFAWAWMMPGQFKGFSNSLIAVTFFASNILFWRESGYFDTASEEKPLLHTWSLAVEEQYYLLFPILMILIWRFGRRPAFHVVMGLALISLLLSEWGWRNSPSANFYLAPSRAWELFAGSLCAFVQSSRGQWRSETGAAAGLGAILLAVFLYDDHTPFPSAYALAPVLGTALVVLFAAPGTWVARLLSLRPMVAVGLISYSAYLWHQPLFAFARIRSPETPAPLLMLGLAALTLILAWISWRFVEQPFRGRAPLLATRRAVFAASAAVTVSVLALGIAGSTLIQPYMALRHADLLTDGPARNAPYEACTGFQVEEGQALCRRYGNGSRVAVLWGDSHAMPLLRMIDVPSDMTLYVIAHHGCPPLAGVKRQESAADQANSLRPDTLTRYADFISDVQPETVALVGRWTLYAHGWWKRGTLQPGSRFITTSQGGPHTKAHSRLVLAEGLARTRMRFSEAGARVLIVTQPPDLNALSARQRLLTPEVDRAAIDAWHAAERDALAGLDADDILDSKALFCDATTCHTRIGGGLAYSDDNHLSNNGAALQWDMIRAALAGPLGGRAVAD